MSTRKPTPKVDPNFAHVVAGKSNEELIAQQEEADRLRAQSGYARVSLLEDEKDKVTEGFGDIDFDPLGLTDPLAALKQEYQRPGFALKLLSEDVNNRIGRRGYQIVKDDSGDPVRCGKMVLGEIPEKFAQARRRAPIQKSNEELSHIQNQHREQVDKLKNDARGMGLQVLEDGERVTSNKNGQDYNMGLQIERDVQD